MGLQQSRRPPGTATTTLRDGPLDRRRELTDFLTQRRAALTPSDVGLPPGPGRRRTPGLRREELALLAGVSLEWYTRLEQGRGDRPSPSVLDALAAALRLSRDERHHLYALARAEHPPLDVPVDEHPDASLLRVLESLPDDMPAMLLGRRWDIVAWNSTLPDLLVPFGNYPARRRNLVRLTFLDPTYRERYVDWPAVAEETVANFRASVARHLTLPDVQELVAELIDASPDFARWWESHQVREKTSGVKALRFGNRTEHFRYHTLTTPSSADQRLVVYTHDG